MIAVKAVEYYTKEANERMQEGGKLGGKTGGRGRSQIGVRPPGLTPIVSTGQSRDKACQALNVSGRNVERRYYSLGSQDS
jgi:hypothetical protein